MPFSHPFHKVWNHLSWPQNIRETHWSTPSLHPGKVPSPGHTPRCQHLGSRSKLISLTGGQPDIHREFRVKQGYLKRPCLKKAKTKTRKRRRERSLLSLTWGWRQGHRACRDLVLNLRFSSTDLLGSETAG